jgi:hypothetical protein
MGTQVGKPAPVPADTAVLPPPSGTSGVSPGHEAPSTAKVEESPKKKKKGFWSRLFGGDDDKKQDDKKNPKKPGGGGLH